MHIFEVHSNESACRKSDRLGLEQVTEEDESILASIDYSSTDNDYDDGSISTNYLEDIRGGSQIHPELNTRYSRLKIRDCIKQT